MAVSNEILHGPDPEWSVAVFARNEQERIGDCLIAIASAAQGVRTHVMLMINGSSDHTRATAFALLPRFDFSASVYTIQTGCKAHAMNEFIHKLRPKAEFYFFIDATAFVEPDALQALATALRDRPDIMAVSGLPINGRGAAKMREGASHTSKLFGQMFAVRRSCLDAIATLGRRLPIGLYRCDGLFAGFICWETNGIAHEWAIPRIATIPAAQWRVRPISWFRLKDIKAGFNRLVRQGRGRIENQAWNPFCGRRDLAPCPATPKT